MVHEYMYGKTYRLLKHYSYTYNIETVYSTFFDVAETEELITEKTRALFIETPINPLMQEIDIQQYAALAKKYNLLFIVDNTFLTIYFKRTIVLVVEIVIYCFYLFIFGYFVVL